MARDLIRRQAVGIGGVERREGYVRGLWVRWLVVVVWTSSFKKSPGWGQVL